MHIPDLSPTTYAPELHEGVTARSVGWLGRKVPRVGTIDAETLDAVRRYSVQGRHDGDDLGYHECEICGRAESRGEFWVEWQDTRYVLPVMVIHYIEAHAYLPPEEFLHAVRQKLASGATGRP